MNKKRNAGVTLLEAMIVIAIIGIIAALAVPSYQDMIERNRFKQSIEGLKSDLQWMRTETIKKSCNLQAAFTNGATWSYQIFIPPAPALSMCAVQQFNHGCTAAATDAATANCNLRAISSAQFTGVTMGAVAFFSTPTTGAEFDFRRGEARRSNNSLSHGSVKLSSAKYELEVAVSQVGRVRICIPSPLSAGKKGLPGYPDC